LVLSLGSVLRSAMPLLIGGRDVVPESVVTGCPASYGETPVGVEIIRAARDYDALTESVYESNSLTPDDALTEMRGDASSGYDPLVLAAMQRVVATSAPQTERELQLAT
jgi:hypothetical protein